MKTKPIVVEDHVWIAAQASIAPGVKIAEGAVLSLASVAMSDLEEWSIYQGHPAVKVSDRKIVRKGTAGV